MYYMRRPWKGLTTSLNLRTKRPNNKQNLKTAITDIANQYFRKLLRKFTNSPYLGCKKKQVCNEQTEASLLLIKHISKLIKSKNYVQLHNKIVKSNVDGTKRANKTIGHVNKEIYLKLL